MTEPAALDAPNSEPSDRRARIGWLAWLAVALVVGFLHLWVTIGPGILLASHPFWILPLNDTSMSVLGAEAFLRDPAWHFPIAATSRLLSAGQPVSIVYTDSAPWIAVALKAAGLGVNDVSAIGLVAALSVLLQPIAVALLLLAIGVRRAESVSIGVVLGCLLPAWYMRLVWHVALSSHWLVVLPLALGALAIRRGVSGWIIAGLAALGALSIGVHAYLFVMVAAIAAGSLLADVARVGRKAVPRATAGLAIFLASSGVSAWLLGYGGGGSVGGFGRFSMNVLSPIVPQTSGLTQLLIGTPRYFLDATGGQYEGFNYLGGGILLCVGVAAFVCVKRWPKWESWRPAIPLIAALVALTLLALSHKVYVRHSLVVTVPLPTRVLALLDEVRSSGRMFWPVAYALLAGAVLVLDRMPRRSVAASVLVAALILQVIDTSVLRDMLRDTYRPHSRPQRTFDASVFAKGGAFVGRDLRVLPSYLCTVNDHETIRQAALAVQRNGGTVEGGPIARFDPSLCGREEIDRAFFDQSPGRLDLLMTRTLPSALLEQAERSGACRKVEGALLCEHRSQRAQL